MKHWAIWWDGLVYPCSKAWYYSAQFQILYWMLLEPNRIGDDGA